MAIEFIYNDERDVLPAGINTPRNKEELEKYYKVRKFLLFHSKPSHSSFVAKTIY